MHYDHKQEIHQTFEDYILLLYKHVNFVDAQAINVALVIVHMKYILPKIYNFIVGSTLKANYLISFIVITVDEECFDVLNLPYEVFCGNTFTVHWPGV